ncbi:MAG: YdcF family protein [Proteobacteria bacterium]|nr:YdcF family protein [Pseudomonadota bacterium]
MKFMTLFFSLLAGSLLAAAGFIWLGAGEIYDYQDSFDFARDGKDIEVVVVLAGGKGRIPLAVELWRKIRALRGEKNEPVLFLSGVGPYTGVEAFRSQGVPEDVIRLFNKTNLVFENVSENTFENAQLFASFARQKSWKRILLVTASYHMRRADFILKRALDPDVQLKTETLDAGHFGRNEWRKDEYSIRVTAIEYIKWLYYRYSY